MARKACLFVVLSLLTASRHSNAFASSFGSFHSTKSSQRATAAPRSPAFAEQGTALQQHQQRDDQPVVVGGGGGGGQRNNQTALHVAAADALLPAPPQKTFFDRIKSVIPTATERKKLIPLAVMYFCILFNYTILRSVKDVLVRRDGWLCAVILVL